MPDREKVIADIEEQIAWIRDNDFHKFPGWGYEVLAMEDALALLKEQEHKDRMYHALEDDWKRLKELLKEQEAVTIKKTKEHGFGVYGGICPKCRNWIQSAHSFCGFCGQAVKWE